MVGNIARVRWIKPILIVADYVGRLWLLCCGCDSFMMALLHSIATCATHCCRPNFAAGRNLVITTGACLVSILLAVVLSAALGAMQRLWLLKRWWHYVSLSIRSRPRLVSSVLNTVVWVTVCSVRRHLILNLLLSRDSFVVDSYLAGLVQTAVSAVENIDKSLVTKLSNLRKKFCYILRIQLE